MVRLGRRKCPQVDLDTLCIKDVAEAAMQGAGTLVKVHGKVSTPWHG